MLEQARVAVDDGKIGYKVRPQLNARLGKAMFDKRYRVRDQNRRLDGLSGGAVATGQRAAATDRGTVAAPF